jgi:SAM-dependent methyltransferase
VDKSSLRLEEARGDGRGGINEGVLVGETGRRWPVRGGVPRMVLSGVTQATETVDSFAYEWDRYGFEAGRESWERDICGPILGGGEAVAGRTVVDAGAGSGCQSAWMLEKGARRVVALELSGTVDGPLQRMLGGREDAAAIVQADIAMPPLADGCADVVYCMNVLQHTAEPWATFAGLCRLCAAPAGRFAFNVYTRAERFDRWGLLRWPLRDAARRVPDGMLRKIVWAAVQASRVPALGWALRKAVLVYDTNAPRDLWAAELDTFDWYGGHQYQFVYRPSTVRACLAAAGARIEREGRFGFLLSFDHPGAGAGPAGGRPAG